MMIKKLFSYFWPQTLKINSDYNGVLEITLYKGKKVLDSKNANYSYGSLQKILEIGISKINMKQVNNVLLLGLGGGSVVTSLRDTFNYQKKIVAVELDAQVIKIAKEEFFIQETALLQIVHKNAIDYITNSTQKFDLIIVDIFVDKEVPKIFYEHDFCHHLDDKTSSKGTILFNLGMNDVLKDKRTDVAAFFKNKHYHTTQYKNILKTNTLLIAHKY